MIEDEPNIDNINRIIEMNQIRKQTDTPSLSNIVKQINERQSLNFENLFKRDTDDEKEPDTNINPSNS